MSTEQSRLYKRPLKGKLALRRRLLVAELQIYQGFSEFWVADPGKKRGRVPRIIGGPYPSRDRCEEAIRNLRQTPQRCPTCQSEGRALVGCAPCLDTWHYGGKNSARGGVRLDQ